MLQVPMNEPQHEKNQAIKKLSDLQEIENDIIKLERQCHSIQDLATDCNLLLTRGNTERPEEESKDRIRSAIRFEALKERIQDCMQHMTETETVLIGLKAKVE